MARTNDDDLGPGLLALGALALGVGAVIAIWSASESPASRTEREAREHEEGTGIEGAGTSAVAVGDPDAGVTLWGPPASWSSERVGIEAGEPEDPQVLAMRRSFGDDAGMAADFTPYRHRGHAVVADGLDGVRRSASCDVRMLPVRSPGGFNCVVRVRCDGVTVYPDSELAAGYAPCSVEGGVPSRAIDQAPTETDGDPELLVDLAGHRVRVRDLRHGEESMVEIELD